MRNSVSSRIAHLVVIDVLATGVALHRKPLLKEHLKRLEKSQKACVRRQRLRVSLRPVRPGLKNFAGGLLFSRPFQPERCAV